MARIIGKTKRMPAVHTDIFRKAAAPGQELNEVPGNHADRRMADDFRIRRGDAPGFVDLLEERVAAETGEFLESVPRRDVAYAVAEQPAQVTHLLLEGGRRGIRIVLRVEQQWMAALDADVLVAAVPVRQLLVVMLAEKARQRMSYARERSIFGQVVAAAAAPPVAVRRRFENVVVDVMSPHRAREPGQ